MEKRYSCATDILKESRLHPVVKLLLHCREELEYAQGITGDVEAGKVSIKVPVHVAFRLADHLWRAFVYGGCSFDTLIFDPHFRNTNNVAPAHYVSIHLTVKEHREDNQLKFYFNRK